MATNYYNVLDRPLGFTQDSYGTANWLTPTEPDTSARELGNTNSKTFLPTTGHNSWYGDYNITSFVTPTYAAVATSDALATGSDLSNTASDNVLDSFPANTGLIYIGMNIRFNRFKVNVTAANGGSAGTMAISYWNGSSWTSFGTVLDGTASGGKPLGAVAAADVYFGDSASYGIPTDWVTGTLADIAAAGASVPSRTSEYFWIKVSFTAAFDSDTATSYIRAKSPGYVSLFAGIYYQPTQADDSTCSVMDMTAASFSDGHTGYLQGIAFALYFKAAGSSTINLGGYCYSCWPTYYIGTNRVITQLTAINIQNTGGTVNGEITNYTGVAIGTMSHNVTTSWRGVHIVGYTGTMTNPGSPGLSLSAFDVGDCTGSVGANGIKAGLYIGVMSGVAYANYGVFISAPASGTKNVGLRVAGGSTAAIWSNGAVLCNSTSGIGYGSDAVMGTGAGGTVTQATDKGTGVTINTPCGEITMNSATLNAGAEATFVVTNSSVAAADAVIICVKSGATAGAYIVGIGAVAAGAFRVNLTNVSASNLSETVVLTFAVIKAVTS